MKRISNQQGNIYLELAAYEYLNILCFLTSLSHPHHFYLCSLSNFLGTKTKIRKKEQAQFFCSLQILFVNPRSPSPPPQACFSYSFHVSTKRKRHALKKLMNQRTTRWGLFFSFYLFICSRIMEQPFYYFVLFFCYFLFLYFFLSIFYVYFVL